MRSTLRNLAEHLLEHSGITSAALHSRRNRRLILVFHNVVPDDAPRLGDQSLHLPLAAFRAVLDECAAIGDIVPLEQLLGAPPADSARPRIALTVDDAYRGFVTLGVHELQRRKLSATLFVAPGILGRRTMWWDAVAGPSGLDAATRFTLLETHAGDHDRIAAAWRDARSPWAELPEAWQIVEHPELVAALASDTLTLAPHSWTHRNLTRCSDDELVAELERPLAWLREHVSPDVVTNVLAYPYGLHDERVEAATAAAGTAFALRVEGGWCPAGALSALRIPRLNVPAGMSRRGLRLRLSGLKQ